MTDVKVRLSGDAQDLISALRKGGDAFKDFDSVADKASTHGKESTGAFGRLGKSLDDMGGPAMTAAAALTAVVAATKYSVDAARGAAAEEARLDSVLKSTANAAGLTKQELQGMANSLTKLSNEDDDAILGAEALMLTFTKVGREIFPEATKAAMDMSAFMGQDLNSSVLQLGKALNDPIEGVGALQRVGVSFTKSQEEQIKAMAEAGDVMGAQRLILAELNTEFGGASERLHEADAGFSDVAESVGNLAEAYGTLLLPRALEINTALVAGIDNITATITVFGSFAQAAQELEEAERGGIAGFLDWIDAGDEFFAKINPLAGLIQELRNIAIGYAFDQEDLTDKIRENATAHEEYSAALDNTGQAEQNAKAFFEDRAKAIQKGLDDMRLSHAAYFNDLADLQKDALEAQGEWLDESSELIRNTADTRKKIEETTAEKIAEVNEKAEKKRQDLINHAKAGRAADLQEELDDVEEQRKKKVAALEQESKEEIGILDKTSAEKKVKLDAARAEEEAARKEHLEKLKLQTALSVLEQTGELEKLTGISGLKAKDAYELVTAGIISIDGKFGEALQGTMGQFNKQQTEVTATATKNQEALRQIYTNTFSGISSENTRMTNTMISNSERLKNAANDAAAAYDRMRAAGMSQANAASGARYAGQASAYGYASGGSFMVPGSGMGDRPYIVNLEAGERVDVTPRSQVTNNTYTANYYGMPSAGPARDIQLLKASTGR